MEAVLELQKVLIKDYYKQFITSINDEEIDFSIVQNPIIYKDEQCFEISLDYIKKRTLYIIDDIKPIYLNALSEVFSKLSNHSSNIEKLNYLKYTTQLFSIPLNQLKKDFYIDDPNSRYYVSFDFAGEIFSFKDLETEANKSFKAKMFKYDFLNFDFFIERTKVISLLPFSLFAITSSFINILQSKINEIQEEIEISEITESKLIWNGYASHLGFLMGQLAELDFIKTPKRNNGETNYTQFAKEVLTTFQAKTTEATLTKYLNTTTEKAQETERNFKKANFNIPHKKEVS